MHRHVGEGGGAAGGQGLAKAIPVVDDIDAGIVATHLKGHAFAFQARATDIDPVGIERACRVVFGAIDHQTIALSGDAGRKRFLLGIANFRPGIAGDLAAGDAFGPALAADALRLVDHVFDKAEMAAQRLGDVGIRLRQLDQDIGKFRQAGAEAAFGFRQPQGADTGLLERGDFCCRQCAVQLPLDRALGDLGKQRPKAVGQFFIAGGGACAPGQIDLCHQCIFLGVALPARRAGPVSSVWRPCCRRDRNRGHPRAPAALRRCPKARRGRFREYRRGRHI